MLVRFQFCMMNNLQGESLFCAHGFRSYGSSTWLFGPFGPVKRKYILVWSKQYRKVVHLLVPGKPREGIVVRVPIVSFKGKLQSDLASSNYALPSEVHSLSVAPEANGQAFKPWAYKETRHIQIISFGYCSRIEGDSEYYPAMRFVYSLSTRGITNQYTSVIRRKFIIWEGQQSVHFMCHM